MSYINFLLSIISTHSLGIFCLILFISAKVLKSDFNLKSKKKMHLFFIPNRNNFYNSSFTLISCLYNYIRIFFFFSSLFFEVYVFCFISYATCPLILSSREITCLQLFFYLLAKSQRSHINFMFVKVTIKKEKIKRFCC